MTEQEKYNLIQRALEARSLSYSPYSGFSVGAALLTDGGEIYTGANVESASYSPTVCAERVAFFSAVHKGERNFQAIAIAGGASGKDINGFTAPCGVCRQVMAEFCDGSFEIILYNGRETATYTLAELLPASFGKNNLK